ncbi:hypothetical protein CLOM_g10482 [Closterium sp. NIES-68]|nr:hypothetical protein CLOM_g10482 [Closterium sp. NIES-68]GJP82868.1 hypothetical protein CLOP_g13095 [Closterium sp. NIES-67]
MAESTAAAGIPETSAAGPADAREGRTTIGPADASSAVDFLMMIQPLKTLKRTGWVKRGVQGPESIGDHMHRMAMMAFVLADVRGIDRERCVKMAIVHDVAEAIAGDITPSCGVDKDEKYRLEKEALGKMCDALGPNNRAAGEMLALWEEYEANESSEARLVKDFDKLEMILQAHEYEQAQGMELQEFFDSTKDRWQTDVGRLVAADIVARRSKGGRS